MALKDRIPLGVALPHRSPEPIDIAAVRRVAQRAEALGFRDLWVTENTLDHVFCFDPVVVLTYAAAVTTTIRLGASVVVLPIHHPALVAHQWATFGLCQRRASDPRRRIGPRPPLRPVRGTPGAARTAVSRRGRADTSIVDPASSRLPGNGSISSKAAPWRQSRCKSRSADLDGRRPSRRGSPRRLSRRRLDGVGRVEHRRLFPLGTDPARGAGEGRA